VTFAEIRFGTEGVGDPSKRAELNDWLAHKVRPMFEERSLLVSEDVMFKWRLLVEEGRKAGHTFSQPDLMIAATALCHGLTILSRDTSDYERAHAPVIDPCGEVPQRRESRFARRAEIVGAVLRKVDEAAAWTTPNDTPRVFCLT
jgi:predicted nucleic acid-binding protein